MKLEPEQYVEHVRRDDAALAETVENAPATPVPTMPGYDTGSLLLHTGAVHRWFLACMAVDDRAGDDAIGTPPPDYLGWFRSGVDELVAALESRGPDSPTWTWGSDQTTGFWFRRAAQETAVHRWDAENAVGEASPIDALLAVDGIDELFDEMLAVREAVTGGGETIHVHATDAAGEWLLVLGDGGLTVTREHAKGDVAARGPASDLLLMLYNRIPVEQVDTFGDSELLELWQREVAI